MRRQRAASGAASSGRAVAVRETPAVVAPRADEKLLYARAGGGWLLVAASLAFPPACYSLVRVLLANAALAWLWPYVVFTVLYVVLSTVTNVPGRGGGFSLARHQQVVAREAAWAHVQSVDVLLPTCGEPLGVLANTWNGVRALAQAHGGPITVYVLDDAARGEVAHLAALFGFRYSVRANRGVFKKAGNLRHGLALAAAAQRGPGTFVVIFDADFRPRTDFLAELLPYFAADAQLGLVQSPQYFDVHAGQHWLQRGAGAVQEFFYRYSQTARQSQDAAICVGTNAIYRRRALDAIGGTALIEHSEDVWTGFLLRRAGWGLRYVPLILAKGLCPDGLAAFYRQQARWCMGSMSLLRSATFWRTPMRVRARLCYCSGFAYYVQTAISVVLLPAIPLWLLLAAPQTVRLSNYALLLPGLVYALVVFPLWHRADYGVEAWSVKQAYGWAHLLAIVDLLRRRPMSWSPTGAPAASAAAGGDGGGGAADGRTRTRRAVGRVARVVGGWRAGLTRYQVFRLLQALLSFVPTLVWTGLALYRVVWLQQWMFLPLLLGGLFAALVAGRITCYRERRGASGRYHDAQGSATQLQVPTLPAHAAAGRE